MIVGENIQSTASSPALTLAEGFLEGMPAAPSRQSGTRAAPEEPNGIETLARELGFESDIALLDHGGRVVGLTVESRAAYIAAYLRAKEAGRAYEPFFVGPLRKAAERLKEERERAALADDGAGKPSAPGRKSKRQKRQQERKKLSVSRRH